MRLVYSQVQDDHFFPMLENRRLRVCSLDVFPRPTTGHCLDLFYEAKSRRIATEDGPERDQRCGPTDPLGSRQWNQRKIQYARIRSHPKTGTSIICSIRYSTSRAQPHDLNKIFQRSHERKSSRPFHSIRFEHQPSLSQSIPMLYSTGSMWHQYLLSSLCYST